MRSHLIKILIAFSLLIACKPSALIELKKAEYAASNGISEELVKITNALQKNNEFSKEAAITLGRLGDKRALPYLAQAINLNNVASREAIIAFGMLKDSRAVPILINAIRNNHRYSEEAIRTLGLLNDSRAVPVLQTVIEENRSYSLTAIEVLGVLGDKSAVDFLMDELNSVPPEDPQNIKFRIMHRGESADQLEHALTFDLPSNLTPKIIITEKDIRADGQVMFRYELKDTEFDSLSLRAEFSVNDGVTWYQASTEGRMSDIVEDRYRGSIIWRADQDNIPLHANTNLLFKLTPLDKINNLRKGVPEIIPFQIDTSLLDIKPIQAEVTGDVLIGFNYLIPEKALVDSFQFHYSPDKGSSWYDASVRQGLPPTEDSIQDSVWVIWDSAADLPNIDIDSVQFRISSSKFDTYGTFDVTNTFHMDNNNIPSVRFTSFDDGNLFKVGYSIQDDENDDIALTLYYSTDEGKAWRQATVSGDISNLKPTNYQGMIFWYADFDITDLRKTPVRLRMRPIDRDPGQFTDSEDFFLKDVDFTKLTEGIANGLIEIKYPVAVSDTTRPVGQYSLDNGRTWRQATLADIERMQQVSKNDLRVNWDLGTDIASQYSQIEAIGTTLETLKDKSIIPNMLMFSTQVNHPSRIVRNRAIKAVRILEKEEDWIIEGMIETLLNPDPALRNIAFGRLQPMEYPNVKTALSDYLAYINSLPKYELERTNNVREEAQQAYIHTLATVPVPNERDLIRFLMSKGMNQTKAKELLDDLDVVKQISKLRTDFEMGRLSMKDFYNQLELLIYGARDDK